jgi:hypothetical protein
MASQLEQLQSDIHYCHQCFQWVVGDGWEEHCQFHLAHITSKVCGIVTYIHTLVRPAFCPFCLGNEAFPAARRLESWTRDRQLWGHMNDHPAGKQWPSRCPHPLCDISLEDEAALQFHFLDKHGISRTRPSRSASSHPTCTYRQQTPADTDRKATDTSNKRKLSSRDGTLEWLEPEHALTPSASRECSPPYYPAKKVRTTTPTISPLRIPKIKDAADVHPYESNSYPTSVSSTCELQMINSGGDESKYKFDRSFRQLTPNLTVLESLDEASTAESSGDEMLFSQYLRSPSSFSSVDGLGEDEAEIRVKSADTDHPVQLTPAPAAMPSVGQEQLRTTKDGLRIRLRVNPPAPRIVLRLTHSKSVADAAR